MTDSPIQGAQVEVSTETLSPVFKLVFLSVLGITLLAFAVNVALVLAIENPSDEATGLIETCSTITKAGFGAIVGLIGGKAI
jgi:hypothetical protein